MSDEIKDLSRPRTRVAFRIDEDVFEAPPVIPGVIIARHIGRVEALSENDPLEMHLDAAWGLLKEILRPASYQRLLARYECTIPEGEEGHVPPVSLGQVQDAVGYLMEAYGSRPPTSASGS